MLKISDLKSDFLSNSLQFTWTIHGELDVQQVFIFMLSSWQRESLRLATNCQGVTTSCEAMTIDIRSEHAVLEVVPHVKDMCICRRPHLSCESAWKIRRLNQRRILSWISHRHAKTALRSPVRPMITRRLGHEGDPWLESMNEESHPSSWSSTWKDGRISRLVSFFKFLKVIHSKDVVRLSCPYVCFLYSW